MGQSSTVNRSPLPTARRLQVLAALAAALLGTAGCKPNDESGQSPGTAAGPAQNVSQPTGVVSCLGRILPAAGTLTVSPYGMAGGAAPTVSRVLVRPGERVVAGQALVELSSGPYLQRAVASAQSSVALAQARLVRARQAGSPEQINAARQDVVHAETELATAARDVARNHPLLDQEYISHAQFDNLETRLKQAETALAQARARLADLGEVRGEDVQVAAAEVGIAAADLARARQDASSAVVRAPIAATVLRVLAHLGEPVGQGGVVELAETDSLGVTAEVYETDIARVHLGEAATVSAPFFPQPLHGTVRSIGSVVERQEALSEDRGVPADARIFKVRIAIADSGTLEHFIKGKVNVVIAP